MADSKYSDGVATIQRLAQQLRGLTDLAEALTLAGSMEQAANEAEERMRAALRGEGAAVEQKQLAEQQLQATQERCSFVETKAAEEAARVVADAHDQARTIVGVAETTAQQLIDEAKAQAAQILADAVAAAKRDVASAADDLAVLNAQKVAAGTLLAQLQGDIEPAQARLDAINEQLATVRKAMSQI